MDHEQANAELAQGPTLPQENTVGLWEIRGVLGPKIDELAGISADELAAAR